MEIPRFDPSEKPTVKPLKPVDRRVEWGRIDAADRARKNVEDSRNMLERDMLPGSGLQAEANATRDKAAEEKKNEKGMETVVMATSPEELSRSMADLKLSTLDATHRKLLRWKIEQFIDTKRPGVPLDRVQQDILRRVIRRNSTKRGPMVVYETDQDWNTTYAKEVLDEAFPSEKKGSGEPDKIAQVSQRRDTGDVIPVGFEGKRTLVPSSKPSEKRTDPGIFDRLMKNARKSLGL